MHKLRTISIFLFFTCSLSSSSAQTPSYIEQEVDALQLKITEQEDSNNFLASITLQRTLQKLYQQQEDWESYISQYCNIGMSYWQAGTYHKMGVLLDSALIVAKKKEITEISDIYATIWSYSGFYYESVGDATSALKAFEKTLTIDQHLYETQAANFDTTYLASDYISIGAWYNQRGDYEEARNHLEEALLYLPENDVKKARIFNNIGYAYQGERSIDLAKINYLKALRQLEYCTESYEKTDSYVMIYNNLAALYSNQKTIDSAYYYLSKLRAIIPKNWKGDLADYYQILGNTDVLIKNFDSARQHMLKSLKLRKEVFGNIHAEAAISYKNIGTLYADQNKHLQALDFYQKALVAVNSNFKDSIDYNINPKIIEGSSDRIELLKILNQKSQSLRAINNPQSAKSTLQLAIQLIDQIRYNYLAEGSKYALLERAMPIYEQAIDLAIEMGELEWALEVAERSKATLLLESIKNSEAQTFAGISEDLLEQEREQKVQIAFYERLLNEAEEKKEQTKYQRELFDLRQSNQAFLEELEQAHPEYYELKYELEYPSVSELQGQLLDNNTALLEYFTGDSSIYLFVLTKEDLQIQKLEKTADFETNLSMLRNSLNQVSPNGFANFTSSSYFIYNNFLQEALNKLPSKINQLLLVPDGQLSYIPFQALIQHPVDSSNISDPRFDTLSYLVQDYVISYAYSSTLLLKNQMEKKTSNLTFGGFAPVFSGSVNIPERSSRKTLSELPFSLTEIENINALLHGQNYLKDAASLANFKNQAADFNILHLSTHAAIDDENPAQSRIYFYDDYLTVNEIYNLPINADLTVLSACETGVGEYKKGEGMLSLARAFTYAGCPSLVTSLWQVNDEKTADLMLTFYEQLLEKQPKNQALQQAQINYLKTASMEAAHPFYWAAFVQVGDKAAIIKNGMNWIWWLIFGGICILLLILYFRKNSKPI